MPANTGLSLKANNGGVSVSGVERSIVFHAVNGGDSLKNAGGNVHGETVNGGIRVNRAASHRNGQGLDVSTKNGGVSMNLKTAVPENRCRFVSLKVATSAQSDQHARWQSAMSRKCQKFLPLRRPFEWDTEDVVKSVEGVYRDGKVELAEPTPGPFQERARTRIQGGRRRDHHSSQAPVRRPEYTPAQRVVVDAQLAEGLADITRLVASRVLSRPTRSSSLRCMRKRGN